ncbi:hypothetical protein GF420_11080 [candidate division GN15 bacterium]|nr:hypothetical protein [candidate division GN15 bacterium]
MIMRVPQRTLLGLLVIAALVFAFSTQATAQGLKIGFVRDDVIKDNYRAWERAQEQWETERKAWEDEAATKEQALQEMIQEYEKQKLILSEEKRREREATIRTKQEDLDAYTRRIFGPNGTAERTQEQLILPLLERVSKAIELVAIEGNYDVVFTMQSGLGYIKETYDLTDQVLERLETLDE